MIKLSLVKKFGIKIVDGDAFLSIVKDNTNVFIQNSHQANETSVVDDRVVTGFTPRLISNGIPNSINGDVLLEITNGKGLVLYISARNVAWHAWKTWRPSMEWLAQQAADKTVTYKDDTQHFGEDVQVSTDHKEALIHKAWVDLNGKIDCDYQDWITLWHVAGGNYKNGEYFISHGEVCHEKCAKYVCHNQEFTDYCEKMNVATVDVIKVPLDKMQEVLKEADDISEVFTSRCVVTPFQDGYSVGYRTEFYKPTKPIFTQAMVDAGELPQIGAKCVYVFIESEDEYIGEIAAIDGDACWFKLDDFGYKTFIGKHKFKPIDTRTEKQKAVDEMSQVFANIDDELPLHVMCEILYDVGYRK